MTPRRRLDTDGHVRDEPSKAKESHTRESSGAGDGATTPRRPPRDEQPKGGTPPAHQSSDNIYERPTVPKPGSAGRTPGQMPGRQSAGASTGIYRPGMPASPSAEQPSSTPASRAQTNIMDDPPVGWLVVVSGVGQGNVLTLGNGINSLGRDPSERLQMDFGDSMVSRKNHTTITYDPRGRKFYVQHGDGINLTYIENEPVLNIQELQPNTEITVGNTVLRFVPLCGNLFDWDHKGADSAT